ncbi:MAG TPA: hypothetical protein VHJ20_02765 [Polyangia bacterium]|nr:hypothetical protein [Polyangia bacterium]
MSAFRRTLCLLAAAAWPVGGCAHAPAVGRGGRVYSVRVATVNGHPTSTRGSIAYPACTLQFGEEVAQVWLAQPSRENAVSPVLLQADEVTLKAGVLLERSWQEATVHQVTDAELASGTAVVYIPSIFDLTVVELTFEPVGEKRRPSGDEDDLSKGGAGLDEPMPRRNVSKR